MGHMRIGTLPATEPWNGVVGRIGVGAAAPEVADATMGAARKVFVAVGEDAGFRQASYLLVDLALAGNKADAAKQLAHLDGVATATPFITRFCHPVTRGKTLRDGPRRRPSR